MTSQIARSALPSGCGCPRPTSDTPVLVHRRLRPETAHQLSVFSDDRWDLTPGIFEVHSTAHSINFMKVPAPLRQAVKHYMWELINHPAPKIMRAASTARLSLVSVALAFRTLVPFLIWLDAHGISRFDQATHAHLDRFLDDQIAAETSRKIKARRLIEVRRLWLYRERLPEPMRLPMQPPWQGQDNEALLGVGKRMAENLTPRIHADTMQPLLMWSLRFVEDLAEDIIAAFTEFQVLQSRDRHVPAARRPTQDRRSPKRTSGWLTPIVEQWLTEQRRQGGSLPGRRQPDGSLAIAWHHLSRIFDATDGSWKPDGALRKLVRDSGLPIADKAYLEAPVTGTLHGRPWRSTPVAYADAPALARLLVSACAVTIAYLSGMRPGELLSLQRDCIEHDPTTGVWLLHGQQWKGAMAPDGEKLVEGAPR